MGLSPRPDHAQEQNVTEEGRDELPVGDEISPQIRRKRLFSAQSGRGMTLQEFQGLSGPRTFGAGSLTLPSRPSPRDSAGLRTGRGEARAVRKQASSASLRDVRAGPWVRGCAFPGPRPIQRLPATLPAPGSTHPAAPLPRPERGLSGVAGPSRPPTRLQLLGGREEERLSRPPASTSRGVGRRPPRQDAPSARPEDLPPGPSWAAEGQRARDRAAPHSPRAAAAAASAWPGGSSLSRQPPPEGTGPAPGAAAKPPTPTGGCGRRCC